MNLKIFIFLIGLVYCELKYKTILDHENKVNLEWELGEFKDIVFKLIIYTDRIPFKIGFGASDRGSFENSDLIVFDVNLNKINLIDSYTDSNGILKKDLKSDYFLLDSLIVDGKIEILFNRNIDTCDKQDYLYEPGTTFLIHFILYENIDINDLYLDNFKPYFDSDSVDMKHASLIRSSYFENHIKNFDSKKSKYFDVLNKDIKLPIQDTTYWCLAYKLKNEFSKKHHITAFESLITNTSQGIVHHMELFHCESDPTDDMKYFNGECKSEEKPAGLTQCRKVIAAWAMGADRFVYPDEVGGVIGGEHYSQYLVLEVHYDNPKLKSNITDSSGIRIYYDDKLRKYDAGIIEIGIEYNAKNSIPPQQEAFHLNGYCLSECTKVSLPKQTGITVFASQLHTHLTGRRVWTSLIRNDKVVKIINRDNHYDQMFQEIRYLKEPIQILPGDEIINTCVYETMSRENVTFGGFSIRNEMCVNYMHYYPASNLEVCKSSINDNVLNRYFTKMNYYDNSETSLNKTIQDNFNSIRWSKLTSLILEKLYDKSPISFSCNSSKGEYIKQAYLNNPDNYFEIPEVNDLKTDFAPYDMDFKESCFNF